MFDFLLASITLVFYLVASIRNWRPILYLKSVNLDKRPIPHTFYRQKVWENKVTIPAHKPNLSTHLWGSRNALKGKVEYVWSYATCICLPWYFLITGMIEWIENLCFMTLCSPRFLFRLFTPLWMVSMWISVNFRINPFMNEVNDSSICLRIYSIDAIMQSKRQNSFKRQDLPWTNLPVRHLEMTIPFQVHDSDQ